MVTKEEELARLEIASAWCENAGAGWLVERESGSGGTATVFDIQSPDGPRALKIHDLAFSTEKKGAIELRRIQQQVDLGDHDCPYLVRVYGGGEFQQRLWLLMNRAPGKELAKVLSLVPRSRIRSIVEQIARATGFLRSKELCHRDIKSANVFVTDDFAHATLLDISVIRNVHDPLGLGTDSDGQMPVVATARYSPPEYLFRLIEPGQELWHALNIYQLGGLLHDLIMRRQLFEEEYQLSKENRYRFAWVVATQNPVVESEEVELSTVALCRSALDKDWRRRSELHIEDFYADAATLESQALSLFGLSSEIHVRTDVSSRFAGRISELAEGVEASVLEQLRKNGVTAKHIILMLDNIASKTIVLTWQATPVLGDTLREAKLTINLTQIEQYGTQLVAVSIGLVGGPDESGKHFSADLPDVLDDDNAVAAIAESILPALGKLARQMTTKSEPIN